MLASLRPATIEQRPANSFRRGDAFKFFMVAYMSFRLLCDFIKPYPPILFGIRGIQWACLLVLLYYSPDIARWLRSSASAAPGSKASQPGSF